MGLVQCHNLPLKFPIQARREFRRIGVERAAASPPTKTGVCHVRNRCLHRLVPSRPLSPRRAQDARVPRLRLRGRGGAGPGREPRRREVRRPRLGAGREVPDPRSALHLRHRPHALGHPRCPHRQKRPPAHELRRPCGHRPQRHHRELPFASRGAPGPWARVQERDGLRGHRPPRGGGPARPRRRGRGGGPAPGDASPRGVLGGRGHQRRRSRRGRLCAQGLAPGACRDRRRSLCGKRYNGTCRHHLACHPARRRPAGAHGPERRRHRLRRVWQRGRQARHARHRLGRQCGHARWLRRLHGQGDRRAAGGNRAPAQGAPLRRAHQPRRARPHRRRDRGHRPHLRGRLWYEPARGAPRPPFHRGLGAYSGGRRGRERVHLRGRPRDRPHALRHHHAVRRDGRHPGRRAQDARRGRQGLRHHQRLGLHGRARERRRPLHPGRPRGLRLLHQGLHGADGGSHDSCPAACPEERPHGHGRGGPALPRARPRARPHARRARPQLAGQGGRPRVRARPPRRSSSGAASTRRRLRRVRSSSRRSATSMPRPMPPAR